MEAIQQIPLNSIKTRGQLIALGVKEDDMKVLIPHAQGTDSPDYHTKWSKCIDKYTQKFNCDEKEFLDLLGSIHDAEEARAKGIEKARVLKEPKKEEKVKKNPTSEKLPKDTPTQKSMVIEESNSKWKYPNGIDTPEQRKKWRIKARKEIELATKKVLKSQGDKKELQIAEQELQEIKNRLQN